MKKFKSVKEFINWLIDNEGEVLKDDYGRTWKYSNYVFYFKGIDNDFRPGLKCVHLLKTINYGK